MSILYYSGAKKKQPIKELFRLLSSCSTCITNIIWPTIIAEGNNNIKSIFNTINNLYLYFIPNIKSISPIIGQLILMWVQLVLDLYSFQRCLLAVGKKSQKSWVQVQIIFTNFFHIYSSSFEIILFVLDL